MYLSIHRAGTYARTTCCYQGNPRVRSAQSEKLSWQKDSWELTAAVCRGVFFLEKMPEPCNNAPAQKTITNNKTRSEQQQQQQQQRLSRELLRLAETELCETQSSRKKCLRELRQWLKGQKHLESVRTDNSFLLRFLRFKKFDVDTTKSVIDKYVHMRTHHPEWFHGLDIQDPKMRELMSSGYLFVLPQRDGNGRRVIFSRASAVDAGRFTACDIMRAHILVYETLLTDEENQIKGLTYVFDEREINFSHLAIWSPSEISKAFSCCERALPLRHQEIHFVHLPWTMAIVFQFAKNLLSQKLRERFQTHASFEKLAKEFDSEILPESCGGKTPNEEMIRSWLEELEAKRDEVLNLDEMRYGLKAVGSSGGVESDDATAATGKSVASHSGSVLEVVSSVRKMENGIENKT